jgi:hypothetical protein
MTMGFFGMLFWILVFWLVYRAWRRAHPCVAVETVGNRGRDFTMRDERQDYIDALESRLSEVEERLDFTERLLATKSGER